MAMRMRQPALHMLVRLCIATQGDVHSTASIVSGDEDCCCAAVQYPTVYA